MIKANILPKENEPYLTLISDHKGRKVTINAGTKDPEYMNPPELVQAALAGCMSMNVRGMLLKAGIEYRDVIITVDLAMDNGKAIFNLDINVDSDGDPAAIEAAKQEAFDNCYVKSILTSDIVINVK